MGVGSGVGIGVGAGASACGNTFVSSPPHPCKTSTAVRRSAPPPSRPILFIAVSLKTRRAFELRVRRLLHHSSEPFRNVYSDWID
jgi:hypothetical protein